MSELNIYQRMANVMRDVPRIHKDANMMGRFKYAGHDKLTEKLQPAYLRHGVMRTVAVASSERDEQYNLSVEVFVTWVNVDKPEDCLMVRVFGSATSGKDKHSKPRPEPTQEGIAVSYAVKVAEFKNLCIYGDDTPDADASEPYHGPPPEERREEPKKKKEPSNEVCMYILGLIRGADSESLLKEAKKEGNKAMSNGDLSKEHQAKIREALNSKGPM